ncbi:MAG: extracellular solute-binding protein [Bacteroidetes bacterium]|nr:MAG: extracellular solute-binding protein [Bacteroidota bacterium]
MKKTHRFYSLSLTLAVAGAIAAVSCGDDKTGKFVDDKKGTADAKVSDQKKFIRNEPAAKWESDWSKENIVVYHWRAEPDNLHPTNGKSNPRRVILDFTQRFILSTDDLRPDLVKSMPEVSADELNYTYELREEPRWDDGSPVTLEDVVFSLMANKCPLTNNPHAKDYINSLKTIKADPANPRKFTMVMKSKYIQNMAFLSDIAIMQRKYFDPKNVLGKFTMEQFDDPKFMETKHPDLEAWAKEFNDPKYGRDLAFLRGLGAYKVNAWEEKQRIELVRKKDHWTTKLPNATMYDASYPDKIILKINVDDNSISLEMKKQAIDVSTWISTVKLIELQEDANFNKNYNSQFVDNFDYQYMGLNMKPQSVNRQPFFTDKKVRRAMAMLTPVDQIIQTYLKGRATRMTSYISPIKSCYNTDLKPVPFDLEGARKLLDEAGWKDSDGDNIRDKSIDGKKISFEFELTYIAGNPVTENIVKNISSEMYKAGIKANIRGVEFVAFYEKVQAHDFDMYMGAWAGSFYIDDPKQIWSSANWENKGSNYVGFGSAESDRLIDSIRTTPNDSVRVPMEKRLQAIIYEDQPYIFLYVPPRKVAMHKRFGNGDFYFEKPGVLLNNMRLLDGAKGASSKPSM